MIADGVHNEPRDGASVHAYDSRERADEYDAAMDLMHPNRYEMIDVGLGFPPFDSHFAPRVLDLGAGTGFVTRRVLERWPGAHVVAVDGAAEMLAQLERRLARWSKQLTCTHARLTELGDAIAAHGPFDLCVSMYTLHHLTKSQRVRVWRSAVHSLKPGGWVVNADIVVSPSAEIEARYQSLRVAGIIERAAGKDSRFRDAESTRRFLDDLERREGDRPITVSDELEALRRPGIPDPETAWLEYREGVLVGRRPPRA